MPTVYYLRHGETVWNAAGRLQGQHDSPLSERGREQAIRGAHILAERFVREGRRPDSYAYVSSPLGRACVTMELLRSALGLPAKGYTTDARLAEISFGAWEGLTLAEVTARDPALLTARESDKWGFLPPGGESYGQLAHRVGAWYADLERDTVVTAHGGTARALLAYLDVAPPQAAAQTPVENGVVYEVAIRTFRPIG